jgi:hypothetical protein
MSIVQNTQSKNADNTEKVILSQDKENAIND